MMAFRSTEDEEEVVGDRSREESSGEVEEKEVSAVWGVVASGVVKD